MAKSIRSKVKKKHRSYMRQTIGEKVRTKNIEAAAKRLADKKKGRGNTKTLSYIKGALGGAGEVDLGQAYYSAIVKHARLPESDRVPELKFSFSHRADFDIETRDTESAHILNFLILILNLSQSH